MPCWLIRNFYSGNIHVQSHPRWKICHQRHERQNNMRCRCLCLRCSGLRIDDSSEILLVPMQGSGHHLCWAEENNLAAWSTQWNVAGASQNLLWEHLLWSHKGRMLHLQLVCRRLWHFSPITSLISIFLSKFYLNKWLRRLYLYWSLFFHGSLVKNTPFLLFILVSILVARDCVLLR